MVILGANAQIARSLLHYYAQHEKNNITLFTHRAELLAKNLKALNPVKAEIKTISDYESLKLLHYDLLINCIGAGTPTRLQDNYQLWHDITEKFDRLALDALAESAPKALYVNFSSGAVYGSSLTRPCNGEERSCFAVNNLLPGDYYALMRLNSEARHRSRRKLRIVDLRIFSFFSRYSDPTDGYFLSDVLAALLQKQVLRVQPGNMLRDYVHPQDLCQLIDLAVQQEQINCALDVYSAAAIDKFSLLDALQQRFALQFQLEQTPHQSPNNISSVYCSQFHKAAELGYTPRYSSLKTIMTELEARLEN